MVIGDIIFCVIIGLILSVVFYMVFYEVLVPIFNIVSTKKCNVNNKDRNDIFFFTLFICLCFLIYIQVNNYNQQKKYSEAKSSLYEETYNEAYIDGAEDASSFLRYVYEHSEKAQCSTDDIMEDCITREDFKNALQGVEESMEEYYARLDDVFSYSGRSLGESLLEMGDELN